MSPLGSLFPILFFVLVGSCISASVDRPTSSSIAPSSTTGTATSISDPAIAAQFSREWTTDFSKHAVPLDEIVSGESPRDGIPPIDAPKFVSFDEASQWLHDDEPVIAFNVDGDARARPLQILIWHEIASDEVAGDPVAITYCPLSHTAIAFERRVAGVGTLRFGTSGLLRDSDLIMWDDRIES
jgi:hypothetical protein